MDKLYANMVVAGTKHFADVPRRRREAVKAILLQYVEDEKITQEQFDNLTRIDEEPEA